MPKNKKQASEFRSVRLVIVQCLEVECYSEHVNVGMGRRLHSLRPYEKLPPVASLDKLKGWWGTMISKDTERWIGIGTPIEKRDLNIVARLWFGFISRTIMPSQNEGSCTSLRRLSLTESCTEVVSTLGC